MMGALHKDEPLVSVLIALLGEEYMLIGTMTSFWKFILGWFVGLGWIKSARDESSVSVLITDLHAAWWERSRPSGKVC